MKSKCDRCKKSIVEIGKLFDVGENTRVCKSCKPIHNYERQISREAKYAIRTRARLKYGVKREA